VGASRDRFRQADDIFDAALDLAPNERSAYLARACADDVELRQRVERLLEAHDRPGSFLESPAVEFAPELMVEPSLSGKTPERAGPFRIIRELGAGGMGVVYLAERDGAEFQQRVALKLVRHLGGGEALLRRFGEERRILALLEHPGIARLIDGGLTADGLPYFAMELVEGQPIDAYCDAHELSVKQRLELFEKVCEAVQYAHEHLVIHRDLKPSNILVRPDGQLKLLDFGIAKLLDPLATSDAASTQTGFIAMTPEYAAPEQIRGSAVSTATDTYALGVLLYVLLAGRRPYEVRGLSPAEVERIVCSVEPPRPSVVAADQVRRSLSGDLDLIVAKAIHKDPARRYSSASAMRDDLRRYRTGLPVLARPDSAAYRFGKFVRRNRVAMTATGITVAALVVSTIFSARQANEAQQQRDTALQEVQRQRAMLEMQTVLASDSRDAEGRQLLPPQRIALAERVLLQQFAGTPWLVVEGLHDLSRRLYEFGERESQRAMLTRARSVARDAKLPSQLALAACARAYSYAYDDKLDSARADVEEAKRALLQPGAATDVVVATCLDAEGLVLLAEDKADSAISVFERVLSMSASGRAAVIRLEVMIDYSSALRAVGRTRDASIYQRRVIQELASTGFAGTAIVPNVVGYLTSALFELGELTTADSVAVSALEAQARSGRYSSGTLDFLHGLALLRMGQLDSADVWIARASRDTTADAGGLSAYIPPALTQLRLEQGRVAEARAQLATLPTGTLIRRTNRAWLGARIRYAEGDAGGAAAALEDSLRAISNNAAKPPPALAPAFVTAAEWRLAAGEARVADSLAVLAQVAGAVDSIALERSAYVGRAELVRARAAAGLGRRADAARMADRAFATLASAYGPTSAYTREAERFRRSLRD
jgi:eukaryotic-like serine/threonine-protein kinase